MVGVVVRRIVEPGAFQHAGHADRDGAGRPDLGRVLRQQITTLERLAAFRAQAAEQIVAAFAKEAQIGPDLFVKLTALVADFAAATGEKAPEAAKKLAEAFNDPVKGAKALDAQLNFLTADQLLQIEAMKRVGDTAGGQAVMLAALQGRVQGLHHEALTPIQQATEGLSGAWKDLTTAMGDSGPVRLATSLYTGFLGLLKEYLTVAPKVAAKLGEMAAAAIPGGFLISTLVGLASSPPAGADNTGKPNFASGTIGRATGGTTDTHELEEMKKRALDLSSAYKTMAETQREAKQTGDFLRETLIKMEDAGQKGTETYNRLRDALVALNQKGEASLASKMSAIDRAGKLESAQYQAQQQLIEDAASREEKVLAQSYQNRLISERTYIDATAAIESRAALARIAALNNEIAVTSEKRTETAALVPKNKTESEEKDAKLAQIDQQLLVLTTQRTKAERDLATIQTERSAKGLAADIKEFDAGNKLSQQTADFIRTQLKLSDQQRFEISLIGQTEQAQAKLRAERQATLVVEEEIHKLENEKAALDPITDAQKIFDIGLAIDRIKGAMPSIVANAGTFAAQLAVAQQNASILQSAFQNVSDTIQEGISRLSENWHSATMYVRDQILQNIWKTLYQLTLQKWILNFGAFVTTSLVGGVAQGAAGSAVGSAGGSALGGAASSAVGSYIGGAGTAIGGAYGASEGFAMGWASGVAAPGAGLAETAGAFLASIPVYGWIAIAVIAVAAYLGLGKGGGPKVGGSSFGSYDPNGDFTPGSVPGTDNGRYFTPDQMDPQLRKLNDATAQTFYQTYAALGGTNAQKFSFGIGADNDPQGTAQSRVSGGVYDAKGNVVYESRDQNMDDKAVPAALQLESDRQVLAALQHSDLNGTVLKVLQSLDVKTAGDQAIKDAIALAGAFSQVLKQGSSDFVKDADTVYKTQQGGARAALEAQGAALVELSSHFDGSMAATQALAQAQNDYRNSLVQLLVQVKQVRDAVKDMFAQSRDTITRAGMTDQEQYNYLRDQSNDAAAKALAATDPATAQRYAAQANDLMMQAFNLLSPEQQAQERPAFLAAIDSFESKFDAHLEQLGKDIATTGAEPFKAVASDMDRAATKMLDAANTINTAANTIANGAGGSGGNPLAPGGNITINNNIDLGGAGLEAGGG
jgi:hypothetical protein